MPLASVIVPTFNATRTLPDTLRALMAQTFRDFEIIVIDDGSSDDLDGALVPFRHVANLRVIHQRNRGLAGARNSGIFAARGQYIGFCDADDIWEPTKLERHVTHLVQNPSVGISYAGSSLIDDDNRPMGHAQSPRLTGISAAHIFKRNPIGNGSSAVLRRAVFQDIAYQPESETERPWFFDETFRQSEDIECWLRIALTTDWIFEGISGLLTQYRISQNGLSAATDRQWDSWRKMVDKLSTVDPQFFARHSAAAKAYQLRYLSRRAISDLDADTAWRLTKSAARTSLRPLLEEPVKTTVTFAAAAVLALGGARTLATLMHLKATRS